MKRANYCVDLHCHTCLSDGMDSVAELIENAADAGLRVLALTDHDVLPPARVCLPRGEILPLTEWAASKGLFLLRGAEFSCEPKIEDVHIIALGCDWTRAPLIKLTRDIALSKAQAYTETVNRLNQRGYRLTMEEVLQAGDRQIHLESLQKKRIFDLLAQKGYASTWADAKLMVRSDPYLNVSRAKPSAASVIGQIHDSGGKAILAHPCLIDTVVETDSGTMGRWDYIDRLASIGLDGIEIRYPYSKTSCLDTRPDAELWAETDRRTRGRLFHSGGSDYHADQRKNASRPRALGECGLTMEEFLSVPFFSEQYAKAPKLCPQIQK